MLHPNIAGLIINNLDKLSQLSSIDNEGVLREGYLYTVLKTYNLHTIFEPIFLEHRDKKEVFVIKTAFILLAYTNRCTWLNFDKDRYINKREIISSLVHDSNLKIEDELVETILMNTDKNIRESINFYMASQKNDLFSSIVAYSENIALSRRFAIESSNDRTIKDVTSITDNLNKLKENLSYFADLRKQLKTTFSDLDEISRREGMPIFTEELDLTDYVTRLKYIQKNGMFQNREDNE